MGLQERVRGALGVLRGKSPVGRQTAFLAGVPPVIQRIGQRAEGMPKPTPANLRKLAETPVARRAINTIKDRIACMGWRVQVKAGLSAQGEDAGLLCRCAPRNDNSEGALIPRLKPGVYPSDDNAEGGLIPRLKPGVYPSDDTSESVDPTLRFPPQRTASAGDPGRAQDGAPNGFILRLSQEDRVAVLTRMFEAPNPGDSFRTLAEQVLEDILVGGFGAVELQATGDEMSPLRMWPVDGATIRIKPDWDGKPESVRYAQETGRVGEGSVVQLKDVDLMYVRSNPRTHTPFGLGRMEVAFEAVNAFLGASRYAARLASNSVVQYALWIEKATPQQQERLIRWWQDEIEGTGRVPLLSCESKPEVLQFNGGTDAELRLAWQEFLMRVIAAAFDLPPMSVGVEHDVNRSTATEVADEAFRNAVRPTALLLAEHFTRDVIQKKLGWDDLEFVFTDLEVRDEMSELEMQTKLLAAGVVTVEEVRAWRSLPERKNL